MKTLFLTLFALGLQAQSLTMTVSPSSIAPGGSGTISIGFVEVPPPGLPSSTAGIQYTLTLPSTITVGAATLGAASTTAQKALTCNGLRCILVGSGTPDNATPFSSGVLVTYPITIAASATGPQTITLASVLGANSNSGSTVTITTSPLVISPPVIISKYDLNADGVVNNADVLLAIAQADGTTACQLTGQGAGDVNGDGICNVADVVLVILATLGIVH